MSRRPAYVSTWDQTREGESWGREAPAKSGKSGCAFAGPIVGRLGFTLGEGGSFKWCRYSDHLNFTEIFGKAFLLFNRIFFSASGDTVDLNLFMKQAELQPCTGLSHKNTTPRPDSVHSPWQTV